jgi:hypothetical protein
VPVLISFPLLVGKRWELSFSLSPTLAHGWAVASQDGGHENSELPNPNQFFLDPQATIDQAYRSTGGRQGMVMSQKFPEYFDGIIAGDPV